MTVCARVVPSPHPSDALPGINTLQYQTVGEGGGVSLPHLMSHIYLSGYDNRLQC